MEEVVKIVLDSGISIAVVGLFIYIILQAGKHFPTLVKAVSKLADAMEQQSESNEKLTEVLDETTRKHEKMDLTLIEILDKLKELNAKYYLNEDDIREVKRLLNTLMKGDL